MKTIKITTTVPITKHNVHKWRGAIIEQIMQHKTTFQSAKIPTHLFHNHVENEIATTAQENGKKRDNKLSNYPLVQYLEQNGKAELLGIGQGATALQMWLALAGEEISVNGKKQKLAMADIQQKNMEIKLNKKTSLYEIKNWIPFNPKKHKAWLKEDSLIDKIKLLNKSLFGQILHITDDLGIKNIKNDLIIQVKAIKKEHSVNCFRIKKLAFDVEITTNLNLPKNIGIGQGAAIGYGRINEIIK